MKLMIRDPIPLEQLLERLRLVNLHVSAERRHWLEQHHQHEGLQLEKGRFYCRTCKATG
jgi:hypothetical protein